MSGRWRVERVDQSPGTQRWLISDNRPLTFDDVQARWSSDDAFRRFWIASLSSVPFAAYCWECPPVGEASRGRDFECVFVDSPSLARMQADPGAFAEHFQPGNPVATFVNLGRDAVLVAPAPDPAGGDFTHLASFTASASPTHQLALWAEVGRAFGSRIGARPLWLSTAGHGVGWLHVRLDTRPKYYQYAPYAAG